MFKILSGALIITLLCTDRNWEFIDKILESGTQVALFTSMFSAVSCESYDIPVKEEFTMGNYRYEVSLPEFSGDFNVTIKYRAMMILGKEPRLKECDLIYFTVTTLPEYVDTSRAIWSFEFGTLVILIPAQKDVKLDLEEIDFARMGCYYHFSTNEIQVPRSVFNSV